MFVGHWGSSWWILKKYQHRWPTPQTWSASERHWVKSTYFFFRESGIFQATVPDHFEQVCRVRLKPFIIVPLFVWGRSKICHETGIPPSNVHLPKMGIKAAFQEFIPGLFRWSRQRECAPWENTRLFSLFVNAGRQAEVMHSLEAWNVNWRSIFAGKALLIES